MINLRTSKDYCKDFTKIENYDLAIADKTQTWECHHRNEKFYSEQELKELGLYYDCPPCELIFLNVENHHKEYHKGRQHTKEWNEKISIANKGQYAFGEKNNFYGKHHTEESKRKMSEAKKGNQNGKGHKHSLEELQRMSEAKKGKHWKLIDGKRVWY